MDRHCAFSDVLGQAMLGAGVAGFLLANPNRVAHADTVINTRSSWDGEQSVALFGCPDTTTYGQVITVPKGVRHLRKFTFWWRNTNSGSMVIRAEVYPWDGVHAGRIPLYESPPVTVSFQDSAFHRETFSPGAVNVRPQHSYVIFVSVDKDYEQCTNAYNLAWGSVGDFTYSGGTFVYQNNAGDETQWSTGGWHTFYADLAFEAYLY